MREEKREGERGKRIFRLSLRSTEIEQSVFVEARRKVDQRIANYALIQISWSLVKLHEIKNFPTLNNFSLKTM